uniref:BTB domain-containing protein n=1 Tax=Oreochromis aureus TaxID=47969 RepID=A0A668W2N0_OREAU
MTGMASPEKASSSKKKGERKCATKEEYRQLSSIMGVMNNLRKQGTLCDVTLLVQGKHFPAHRVVLAAASHFFSLMFTSKMMESMSHEVELRSAEPEIIELLIEFIYTARISVNSSNVQSLLDAANQYQIEPVKRMCVEFLKGQIDATNCLGISALADCMDCPELKVAADDFFQIHFTEVYKLDEFLQLDVAQLTHLLHQDKLTVRAEAQIYDAAVRWLKYDVCNRKQYMVEVLGCVRFPLVSKTFLSKTVQAEPLIQDNPQCLKMVIGGMRYHLLSLEDREDLGESSRPRRKKHDYRIALFGGSQPQSCRYFNPKDSSWTDIRCPFEKRRDATAVFWDNVVYILGGSQLFPIKRMDCYNVLKDSWYSKLGPPTPRDSLAACAAQGKIYTSGGSEVGTLGSCATTQRDADMGCGNIDNDSSRVTDHKHVPTESWQIKTSMLMARCSHGSVEANGLIYVCGGTVGNNVSGGLDSVEYYDIATNEWRGASPMPWRGVTVKCAAVGDIIYVLAGFQGVGRLGHTLEYHTETDRLGY